MKRLLIGLIVALIGVQLYAQEREYVIVVHGGAGAMKGLENDEAKAAEYYAALDSALTIRSCVRHGYRHTRPGCVLLMRGYPLM